MPSEPEKKYFKCNPEERAAFELGIKLSTIHHQFIGMPFRNSSRYEVAKLIEESISSQPYVEYVKVEILESEENGYGYSTIDHKNLKAEVRINYNGIIRVGKLSWIGELSYPLMYMEVE
ncbi:dihydroneopterin aldolase family protein [Caldiplasma sukawensis]